MILQITEDRNVRIWSLVVGGVQWLGTQFEADRVKADEDLRYVRHVPEVPLLVAETMHDTLKCICFFFSLAANCKVASRCSKATGRRSQLLSAVISTAFTSLRDRADLMSPSCINRRCRAYQNDKSNKLPQSFSEF